MKSKGKMSGIGIQKTNTVNFDKFRFSITFKVTLSIILIIAFISSLSISFVFYKGKEALDEDIREKLALIASNAAVALDIEKLKTIKSIDDEGNETYLELQKKLQQIKAASKYNNDEKIMYIYTFRRTGDHYEYVLDAAPINDRNNHSSVGDRFPIEKYPVAVTGFEKPVSEKVPTHDVEFNVYSLSGYAPIIDKSGSTVGVVGVDMNVQTLKKEESAMIFAGLAAFLAALLLAMLSGFMFSQYLTKPILILTKGIKSVSEGNFKTVADIKRNDELGQLANSFNLMTQDLKQSHEALRKSNLELENIVLLRTAELLQINKEIKDILDNMSQAIFTIGPDLKFNSQYSRYAYVIFGQISFEGKNILDVFFPSGNKEKERTSLEFWLNKVFDNKCMIWKDLKPLQPVTEVAFPQNSGADRPDNKYIQVSFEPIIDISPADYKETVAKIMVIVQDITEKKVLEQEVERKEQQFKDNIEQIVEVIRMDRELFEEFVKESKDSLLEFEPILIKLRKDRYNKDYIDNLFRIMHTLKGNSKIFNLERISAEAHAIESLLSPIREGTDVMTDELLDKILNRFDRFNSFFSQILDIYNKIFRGISMDTGRTRSAQRQKEDDEIIKVKVHTLNRLAQLIKEADRIIAEDISGTISSKTVRGKIEIIENLFKETEKQLESMRKINLGRLFARFPRMVHDLSQLFGKKINFVTEGDELEVDKYIFDRVADPLVHIIRNSADHGIEKPHERISLGKPAEGLIQLSAATNKSELVIDITDDGKGLDPEKIKNMALEKGFISHEQASDLTEAEAIKLIFIPGFSTVNRITSVSGRGVGMDVVKMHIEEKLKGSIYIESAVNAGLKITLTVPLADYER